MCCTDFSVIYTYNGGGGQGGRPLPLPPPYLPPPTPLSPSSLLERAQIFSLFPSLPFFLPSPSSRPLFSLLPPLFSLLPPPLLPPPPPLLPPPAPSSPPPSYPVHPLMLRAYCLVNQGWNDVPQFRFCSISFAHFGVWLNFRFSIRSISIFSNIDTRRLQAKNR